MAANRDEILLERLQKTIDTWSTEVTSAQESLANQIGEARTQLHTLIGALNRRGHSNGNGEAARVQAVSERDAALREALERNRALETQLRQIGEGRATPSRESDEARAQLEELRGQIAAYQAQERQGAALIERAEKEISAMRRANEASISARQGAVEEVQRLREATEIASRERDGFETEARRLRGQLDDRQTVNRQLESELVSLTAIVNSLHGQLEAAQAESPARIAQLESELRAAARTAVALQERLDSSSDEEAAAREKLAAAEQELKRLRAEGELRERSLEAAMREAEELRGAARERGPIEEQLRAEVQALRDTVAVLRRSGEELDGDLAALKAEYDRQSETLTDTVREIEAHWEVERQAGERERQLQASLTELQRLYSAAQSEVEELRQRSLLAASGTAEAAPAPGGEDSAEALERLLAFEQILIEREAAVEAAAERMLRLENAAIRLQTEVANLQSRGEAAPAGADRAALESARSENERLWVRIAELERLGAEQAARIAALERPRVAAAPQPAFISSAPAPAVPAAQGPSFAARDASGQKKSMGEILVGAGIISGLQLESALEEQRSAKKRRLGSILVEKGLIREEIVAQVVAAQLNLPFVRLSETAIQRGAVALLDGRLATHHMCFPVAATTAEVTIAMANPLDVIAIEDLEFATHLKVKPVVATLSDITSAIVEHYGVAIANAIAEDHFDIQSPVRGLSQERPAARD